MAQFDRINGRFQTVKLTFEERLIFKRNKWKVDPRAKCWWTDDIERALAVKEHAIGDAKEHLDNALAVRQAAVDASWAEDTVADFPAPEGKAYMPFQRAGIEYAVQRERTLIADPPGLGKTIQAIGVHNVIQAKRVLIVCPASLKRNWEREWNIWDVHGRSVGIAHSVVRREAQVDSTGEKFRDPDGKIVYKTWTEHVWDDSDVMIVNYDMLETFNEQIKYEIVEDEHGRRKKVERVWDLVICDEAHLLKTDTALRTMCVLGGKKKGKRSKGIEAKDFDPILAKRHLYLTGTPILSKPIELWNLIRACDPKGLGASWEYYVFEFCDAFVTNMGTDTSGASNLDTLNRILRERFMVRRDKQSVLKELPDKTRELVLLPKDKLEAPIKKEQNRIEAALAQYENDVLGIDTSDLFRYIDDISDKLATALANQDGEEPDWDAAVKTLSAPEQIMFTEISAAREEVALAKVGMVVDHIEKLVTSEEPVICFGYHKSVIRSIKERLEKKGIRVGVITGDVPAAKRQDVVDDFQDGKLDVILGNIIAMGVGFTLTRARFVVFAELDWVPAMIEQAEDRAWRHGQLNAVLVQHLVVDGSIEGRMAIALLEKMGIIKETLDSRN